MAWSTAKAVISHLDQRFEAEKELLYWQHRLKSSRLDTLLSGVSLAIFWAYLELQRLNFPSPEDLDFQSILHLVGAFLLAIASSLSFLEVNLEFLWLPLACVYCAFLAQLRSDVRERLVCVAFAAAVSLTLPLRAATAWLVHLSALLGFAFSISELDAGMFALTGALLLLLVCNFYHSLWRAEARSRSVFLAGELVHQMCEVPDQDEMRGHYFESGKPEHAVLSLDTDLMIGSCGELERSFFQSDLFGRNLKELVSMEDQHMIGLLARSENPQRTILVKLMELGGSESVKLRLLPTGLQSPKWLAFFARGDAKTYVAPSSARDISSSISNSRASANSIRPASPRAMLPSVPDDAGNHNVTIKLETPAGPPAKPVELTPPAPGPPMQKRLSGSSVRSNHSILSEGRQLGEHDKRRRRPSMDGIGSSPGLRWPKQGSNLSLGAEVESPRMRSEADLLPQQSSSGRQLRPVGEFNDSVLSLSAASWSIEPDYLRQVTPAKCLSDAQVQTEISWNKIGWHCKCTRPPRPPSPRQEREVQLERALHRLQGCWLLTNGHVKTVGWLQGFVIRGMEVSTTSGIINLTIDDDNQLMLAGGHVSVDQDDVLHRTGKSGGSYTYVKVTEQRLSVMTLANQQGQQRPRLGSFDSLSSVLP